MGILRKSYDMVDKHRSPLQTGGFTLFDLIRPAYEEGNKDGLFQGKKDGYEEASCEYEKKLLAQADSFLRQSTIFEGQKAEYEALLMEYEVYIDRLESRTDLTVDEKNYMSELIATERKLKKMQ